MLGGTIDGSEGEQWSEGLNVCGSLYGQFEVSGSCEKGHRSHGSKLSLDWMDDPDLDNCPNSTRVNHPKLIVLLQMPCRAPCP